MSHDIDERHDGLDDGLRERLSHLGRSATAGSLPWPGVDRAIHRRRRTTALRTGAVAVAVAAVAASATVAVPRLLSEPTAPAGRDPSVTRSFVPAPPWKVPTAGFTPLYENVRVRLAEPRCDHLASINFRDPTRVGRTAVARTDTAAQGDLSVGRPCTQSFLTRADFGVPLLLTLLDGPGHESQGVPTAADCVRDLPNRREALGPDTGFSFSRRTDGVPDDGRLAECAILPADPRTGRPATIVGVHLAYVREGVVDVALSAWTGTDEIAVGKEQPRAEAPPVLPKVSAPFRERYRDVTLRLPGKPAACAAEGGTFLELHVPEVSPDLAPSDAMLTLPCPDPASANLQLGTARGVVLTKADVSAGECASALGSGTKVDTFEPVEGTTLCIVSPALDELRLPAVLAALTVTKVDARTGAFDLSATGWTGTPG